METRIIFIVLLIALPPNPIPDQVSSELMLSENMIGDMSGNEELLSNKAKKTQMTQKSWQVDMARQGDKHSTAKSGPHFPLFAEGHKHISQGQVWKALKAL